MKHEGEASTIKNRICCATFHSSVDNFPICKVLTMAAYGALVSLMQTLTAFQPLDDRFFTRQIPSLTEKVSFLLNFLEKSSTKTSNEMMASLEKSIRDAASAAEDLIVKPRLNEVLFSQLLSAPKRKSPLLRIVHFIPIVNRVKSWVADDLMHRATMLPFFIFSSMLSRLVIGVSVVLEKAVFSVGELFPLMYAAEPMMFVIGPIVYVVYWLASLTIFAASHFVAHKIIFMGAEAMENAMIRILRPNILINSINAPLRHNFAAMYDTAILHLVIGVFESIIGEVNEIRGEEASLEVDVLPAVFSRLDSCGANVEPVGLDSDLALIREQLASSSLKCEVVSIVGMSGIGKTTLARGVHDDSYVASHFYIRAWVTVSQEHPLRNVMLDLLDSAKILTQELQEADYDRLGTHLYQTLIGRRYLIVMDGVWDKEIWDSVRKYLPTDYNGSRVLLTTQLSEVALYANSPYPLHQMRFLTDDQSWSLLCRKVFGDEFSCPLELEEIGKDIARTCRGLPLTIVVIAGLLSKDVRTVGHWRDIARNLNLKVSEDGEQCLEILGLSYNHLPLHLRPCFLYMGVFPEYCEIPISKIISLWIAEGFLKPSLSKSMEEVAEENLKDLIERSLILVGKHSSNGKAKTCYIHDLLRQVCLINGKKENFLHVVNSDECLTEQGAKLHRRLSVHPNTLYSNRDLLSSYSFVRSFLCISKHLTCPSKVSLRFALIRVLDIVAVQFHVFPEEIVELVNLRYLGFNYNGQLPSSIAKLSKLETIVHQNWRFGRYFSLPMAIWSLPNLRHVYVNPSCLPDPGDDQVLRRISALENLKSLAGIRNLRCTISILRRIPNVKVLGLLYDATTTVDWSEYLLESLVDLNQLEALKIVMKNPNPASNVLRPPRLAFPQKLRELTLSGCRIAWGSMTVIGELPDLRVLKLRRDACFGLEWEPVEGGFSQLKHLLLEEMDLMHWKTDETHFPLLQRLIIRSCYRLEQIPSGIGEIPTLELIELVHCLPSAVESANNIMQAYQENAGDDYLKIHINPKPHFKDRINSRILR